MDSGRQSTVEKDISPQRHKEHKGAQRKTESRYFSPFTLHPSLFTLHPSSFPGGSNVDSSVCPRDAGRTVHLQLPYVAYGILSALRAGRSGRPWMNCQQQMEKLEIRTQFITSTCPAMFN
jgi:hypothetical protein